MRYVYPVAFIVGLLLAVRLMFFGAERRRQRPDTLPLRRSEPAGVGFLLMFGGAGSLLARTERVPVMTGVGIAVSLGVIWAVVVARIATAMARVTPGHDPDDPRFVLQGHVGVVRDAIPSGGAGWIAFDDGAGERTCEARSIDGQPIESGLEVCIERIDDGVAWVELWSLVEARL